MRHLAFVTLIVLGAAIVAQARFEGVKPGQKITKKPIERDDKTYIIKYKGEAKPRREKIATANGKPKETPEKAIEAAKKKKDVEYVELNYKLFSAATPDDFTIRDLWHLPQVEAPAAWDTLTGSKDITVCVVDTGVDYDHEDLNGNFKFIGGVPVGRDETTDTDGTAVKDVQGHGTHCSGIAGGVGNNGKGVVGVSQQVTLIGCQGLSDEGWGYLDDLSNCITWCADKGADVISASWGGGGYSTTMFNAISYANSKGALFVAAAGNEASSTPIYPAYYAQHGLNNVVAVAATDRNDALASFSNYGSSTVHIAAPGVGIMSSTPGNSYAAWSGTSMACPVVSGAAALVLAAAGGPKSISPADLRQKLMDSGDAVSGLTGKVIGGKRLNVKKLLASVAPPPEDPCKSMTCQAGICEAPSCTNGVCGVTKLVNGEACTDANGIDGTCDADSNCVPPDPCKSLNCPAGTCEKATCASSECGIEKLVNGEACKDANGKDGTCDADSQCILPDLCKDVSCTPGTCQASASCDPDTGKCVYQNADQGSLCKQQGYDGTCDGAGKCIVPGLCGSTICSPGVCQASFTCVNNACVYSNKLDGTFCQEQSVNGTCKAGKCALDPCFNNVCPSTNCKDATCSRGKCGFKNKPMGTSCTEQGLEGTCTGDGKCNTCISTCKSSNLCEAAYCNPRGECKRNSTNKGMACNNGGSCKGKSCASPEAKPSSKDGLKWVTASSGKSCLDACGSKNPAVDDGRVCGLTTQDTVWPGTRNSTNFCSGVYQLQVTNTFALSGATYVCGCNTGKQSKAVWATSSACPSGTAASPRICLSGDRVGWISQGQCQFLGADGTAASSSTFQPLCTEVGKGKNSSKKSGW